MCISQLLWYLVCICILCSDEFLMPSPLTLATTPLTFRTRQAYTLLTFPDLIFAKLQSKATADGEPSIYHGSHGRPRNAQVCGSADACAGANICPLQTHTKFRIPVKQTVFAELDFCISSGFYFDCNLLGFYSHCHGAVHPSRLPGKLAEMVKLTNESGTIQLNLHCGFKPILKECIRKDKY